MSNVRKNIQLCDNKLDSLSQTPSWVFEKIQCISRISKTYRIERRTCSKFKKKKSEVDDSEEPVSKQPKIADAINAALYGPEHPRQQSMTNAMARMIFLGRL